MQCSLRHIVFLIGIVLFLLSFLFWGRQQSTYIIMLLTGACFSFFALLAVIGRDETKSKWMWIAIMVAAVILQRLTEPIFINWSFRILFSRNRELFEDVNKVLIAKPTNIYYWNKASIDTAAVFTPNEKTKIYTLFDQAGVSSVSKDSVVVYYETFGMLDARIGMYNFYNGFIPTMPKRKIKASWYY